MRGHDSFRHRASGQPPTPDLQQIGERPLDSASLRASLLRGARSSGGMIPNVMFDGS